MKTFTCAIHFSSIPETRIPMTCLYEMATIAARAEGFLSEGELFPTDSVLEIHKNGVEPLHPTLVVLVPELGDETERFDALLAGVNLDC